MALHQGTFTFMHVVLAFTMDRRVDASSQATGEATLAAANQLGIVDAFMTNNSDIFSFGARKVILL